MPAFWNPPQAAGSGPSQSVGEGEHWVVRAGGGGKTSAGVQVSEYTALNLPVVYACWNRVSNPVARFPLKILRKRPDGGTVEVTDHPMSRKLGLRPNEFMSSRTLRKAVQRHALSHGNGYAEIERNGRGQAVGLWPLLPDRTAPVRWAGDDRLVYRTNIDGKTFELDQENVLHIMDQSYDGYVGQSPIWHARQAIGLGLAMEEFGAKFFSNDAKSGGFLMHPGKLGEKARENLTDSQQKQGGLDKAHRVKVLEEGMKFVSTTIPPEDAQFLSSREFQVAEIARIYDVPLVLLQSHEKTTSWGSGIEQLMIGFVTQTIDPWVGAWEQELNWKLFTEEEIAKGYYVKFNMNALLRGDMAARATFYRELFAMAGLSPNQLAALEDMEPAGPDGDARFVPANFTTLERAVEGPPAPRPGGADRLPPVGEPAEALRQPPGREPGGQDEGEEEREAA